MTGDALSALLFYRCPDCGAPAGEYLGDEARHVFGVTHKDGCPSGPTDDAIEYVVPDDDLPPDAA